MSNSRLIRAHLAQSRTVQFQAMEKYYRETFEGLIDAEGNPRTPRPTEVPVYTWIEIRRKDYDYFLEVLSPIYYFGNFFGLSEAWKDTPEGWPTHAFFDMREGDVTTTCRAIYIPINHVHHARLATSV